ncbi:hypothetical protein HDU81_007081 [Chytriomyces hyalinus]|nr:hypothetical protein HDU81_007081 [Chytriomyces hyalinus]
MVHWALASAGVGGANGDTSEGVEEDRVRALAMEVVDLTGDDFDFDLPLGPSGVTGTAEQDSLSFTTPGLVPASSDKSLLDSLQSPSSDGSVASQPHAKVPVSAEQDLRYKHASQIAGTLKKRLAYAAFKVQHGLTHESFAKVKEWTESRFDLLPASVKQDAAVRAKERFGISLNQYETAPSVLGTAVIKKADFMSESRSVSSAAPVALGAVRGEAMVSSRPAQQQKQQQQQQVQQQQLQQQQTQQQQIQQQSQQQQIQQQQMQQQPPQDVKKQRKGSGDREFSPSAKVGRKKVRTADGNDTGMKGEPVSSATAGSSVRDSDGRIRVEIPFHHPQSQQKSNQPQPQQKINQPQLQQVKPQVKVQQPQQIVHIQPSQLPQQPQQHQWLTNGASGTAGAGLSSHGGMLKNVQSYAAAFPLSSSGANDLRPTTSYPRRGRPTKPKPPSDESLFNNMQLAQAQAQAGLGGAGQKLTRPVPSTGPPALQATQVRPRPNMQFPYSSGPSLQPNVDNSRALGGPSQMSGVRPPPPPLGSNSRPPATSAQMGVVRPSSQPSGYTQQRPQYTNPPMSQNQHYPPPSSQQYPQYSPLNEHRFKPASQPQMQRRPMHPGQQQQQPSTQSGPFASSYPDATQNRTYPQVQAGSAPGRYTGPQSYANSGVNPGNGAGTSASIPLPTSQPSNPMYPPAFPPGYYDPNAGDPYLSRPYSAPSHPHMPAYQTNPGSAYQSHSML